MIMRDLLMHLSSAVGGLMIIVTLFRDHFPPHLRDLLEKYTSKLVRLLYPYIQITFPEYTGERLKKSDVYTAIQNYLTEKATTGAKKLKADTLKDSQSLILSMDDNEEVTDEFQGAKLWWFSNKIVPKSMSMSFYPATEERRFYRLVFHKHHRDLITGTYIKHVMNEGKAIALKNRQRKLFTNNPSNNWYGYKSTKWSHVVFEHPATFDTLAMEPKKKQEIMSDLKKFSEGKEYYKKIGKAWKRGYLLYGPPGTGKSTMIAAMANFMNYDVYDLELTTVKDNSELRKLLIDTSTKSIIVIEDIDCSLDLTGQRKKAKKKKEDDEDEEGKGDPAKKMKEEEETKASKVTLSGLLNFIDGIWSGCGGERIIIFTTNFIDKLDPALIRRGRMDKHIEMSYCCFEAFKVLANNYLDVESHPLFGMIEAKMKETNMTPADVAENLMPKSSTETRETCLRSLIKALEEAKEEAAKKMAEEEEEAKESEAKDAANSIEEAKENGVVANGKLEEEKLNV
ncbi:AAA-ATPase ASD, mitochondrial-like [Punica granatum]|uniref:AAA-ATPase ASD, mitochondrial-like n=1 Tax=Punica granatum TaxID=22663 RepID=A0A6P8EDB9_PUNGR|nr:AAA-ATPase ASD, mitochondrial-like [Punica granatum]